jgi:hypothetical protein
VTVTAATLRAMRRRAADNRRSAGRPRNSLRAQLERAADDVERLAAEVDRLRAGRTS